MAETVGLLATIIPGFRSLRTPVTAGVLWICTLVAYMLTHGFHVHVSKSATIMANALLPDWVGVLLLPAALTAAYLLGSVMVELTDPLVALAITTYRRLLGFWDPRFYGADAKASRLRAYMNRLQRRSGLISENSGNLMADYVRSALTDAGATGTAAMMFPIEKIHKELNQSSAQLSQAAPVQYQEYDRIQAEAEFRCAVVTPLIVLSCELPLAHRWFYIGSIVIASIVLLVQSVSLNREAIEILASAARLGYLIVPEIKSLTTFLEDLTPKPTGDGEWMAAIMIGLQRRGFFGELDAMLVKCAEQPKKRHEVQWIDRYLVANDAELADRFRKTFIVYRGVAVQNFDVEVAA